MSKAMLAGEIRALQGQISSLHAKNTKINEKIRKLRTAKHKLIAASDDLSDCQRSVKQIQNEEKGSFRGDQRDLFDEHVSDMAAKVNMIRTQISVKRGMIVAKIAQLETEKALNSQSIGLLNSAISTLQTSMAMSPD